MRLHQFIMESNAIEGIDRDPYDVEIEAHEVFLALDEVTVKDLEAFVLAIEPGAELRDKLGLNVRVGLHNTPNGGPYIRDHLDEILGRADSWDLSPYQAHLQYENLHPFTDGNGRSGRVLWLYMMLDQGDSARLGFLHTFYYQSLRESR